LVILCLLTPFVAWAQSPEVERLLREGIELRQRGDPAAALASFERAHQLARTPRTLAQVALAEQALGRWVDAETHLREALGTATDPWITRNRAALDGALGVIAQHVGQVLVRCDVDGAAVRVAGRHAGECPLAEPVHVEAGEVEVSGAAPGTSATERINVTAGQTAIVTLRLRPDATSTATTTALRQGPSVPEQQARPLDAPSTAATPGSAQRAWGWVLLVGGIVGVGVGVGGVLVRDDGVRAYNDNVIIGSTRNARCPGTSRSSQPDDCPAYLQQVENGTVMQWAGLVGGGVLTLTGIILLAAAPSRTPRPQAHLTCGSGPGDWGISCAGRF